MIFTSSEFFVFFVIVYGAFLALRNRCRGQNVLLVIASYTFYGWWDWRFLSLLLVSTVVDYVVGRKLAGAHGDKRRKALLLVSLTTNLSILGFFKYFNFFIESFADLLQQVGLEAHLPVLRIILPIGISFYTFQTLAYTIDVYQRRMVPVRDLSVFALYVCYFPQLVAGPIERAQNLIPQLEKPRVATLERFNSGALLVLIGLVRKVAIADVAGLGVDAAFNAPGEMTSLRLAGATVLFGLQIYGDFAGYSDMARGFSRMLGVELMRNFNQPYFSTNITVFWRRWHISLSTWLRDYLYIFVLGGNRKGKLRTYRNLMLTMLLGGLWHGAAWTFVVWGGLHGCALALHKLWLGNRKPLYRPPVDSLGNVARVAVTWLGTMILVHIAWVFFRAPDFSTAFEVLSGIFAMRGGLSDLGELLPLTLIGVMLLIDIPQYLKGKHTAMQSWPLSVRSVTYAGLILLLVLLWGEDEVPFIYFQF